MRRRVLLASLVAVTTCRSAGRTRVSNGDIEVGRVSTEAATRATAGSARSAMRGDWVLRDRDLRVTVTGGEGPARNEPPGTVAQVSMNALPGVEAVRSVEPLFRVGGRDVALQSPTFEAVLEAGVALLRVRGSLRVGAQSLEVLREYSLETGRMALHVRTVIRNQGPADVVGFSWGARLVWGGAAPFAPGIGLVNDAREGRATWVGQASQGAVAAWTRATGSRDELLRFTIDQHGSSALAGHTDAVAPPITLTAQNTIEDRAVLLAMPGDLTDVARAIAYARGERIGEAAVVLLGGAREPELTVTDARGTPVLIAHPTGDTHSLPLAPGEYIAAATATGHAPSDPVRFVVTPNSAGAIPVEVSIPRGGHLRVDARDDDTGRELPVRVTVRGIHPTRDPNLGPNDRAAGAGVVAVAMRGQTEIPVPPGRYKVTVSHGPEWTIATQEVTVTETLRGDVSVALQRVVPMDSWVGCDLHVHSNPSFDSRVTVEDRVATLVSEGVGFATPTEHNVVGDYSAGVAMLPDGARESFLWVPAVEVTTDRSAQPWGHFNVYPFRPDPATPGGSPPPFLNTAPRQIFRAARANNPDAFIQVNHPRMQPNIGYFNVTGLDPRTNRAVSRDYDPGYDAIEVFNGFYLGSIPSVEAVLHDWMSLLGAGARYVATGSSDSHHVMYSWAGYPRTYVRVAPDGDPRGEAARESATVLRELRRGRAFVTSGPMLFLSVGSAEPGDMVQVSPLEAVSVRVKVMAAPWIAVESVDLFRDGQRVATLTVPAATTTVRLDAELSLPMSPGSFLIAVAHGPRGGLNVVLPYSDGTPFAFTNPIFFEARPR